MTVGDFIRNVGYCDLDIIVYGIRPYYEALELNEDREVVIAKRLDMLIGTDEQDTVADCWDKVNVTHFEIETWYKSVGNRGIVRLFTDTVITEKP